MDTLLQKGLINQDTYARATTKTKALLDEALQKEAADKVKAHQTEIQTYLDEHPIEFSVDSSGAAAEMQRATAAIYTWQGGAEQALSDYADASRRYGEMAGQAISYGVDTAADAITTFAETGKLAVKELVDSIIADLMRLAIKQAIIFALTSAFGGGGAAAGSRGFSAGDQIDARASGGPVRRGRAYLVGENGPELFTPGSSGMIHPNGASSAAQASLGGGGGGMVVNMIDKRGTDAPTIEQRQRKGAGGRDELDLIVADSHQRNLSSGRHDSMMREQYGARQRPLR